MKKLPIPNNRYLAFMLGILMFTTGLQTISITKPSIANALPTQQQAIDSLNACVTAINSPRFTRSTLPNLLFLTDETALLNAITSGYITVVVLTTTTTYVGGDDQTELICGDSKNNSVLILDSYNPGSKAEFASNTGAGPFSTMPNRGRDFFFGGAGDDSVGTMWESLFWGGPGNDRQGPGSPNFGTPPAGTTYDTIQRSGTFNEAGNFFEQGFNTPSAPGIGTPTLASDTSVSVPFTAPGSDGGAAITSYTAVSTPGSITGTINQSGNGSITVTGLTMGVDYTFKVYASNNEGPGTSSSTSSAVHTPDPVPTISSATISGSVVFGETLTANTGTVGGNPTGTTYQWKRDSANISGATSSTYQLASADVGTTISVTITVTNAQGSASATSVGTAIVGKASPSFTWSGISKGYGDLFTVSAPSPSTPGTFTYTSANTSVVTLNADTATVIGVGTSLITATFTPTDTSNYRAGETTTMTVTTARATVTVTPNAGQSKVYGASDQSITYSITSGSLVGNDQLVGALTYSSAGQNTAVGSYSITSGTLVNANNPNYSITLASVNFAITRAAQSAVSLSSLSNSYNPSNKTVTLTGSGGTGTGSYTYELDPSNITPGCSVSGTTLTYATAGTCVIAITRSSDTNYLARTDVVSFTIGLASQTITFGSLSAKSYSSETFTVSATSSSSLTVVFTSGSPLICTTSGVNGSVITLLGVGTCVIYANQIGDSNTAPASQVSQNFSVNPRAITITADAKTKIFQAADPDLTYTVTTGSLLLGDSLTGTLSRAAGTDAGVYQIQQGTLSNANNPKYAITYVSDDLTVTRATPALVLTYPNNNVAILRPGAVDTPTVTTSSSLGALTFATAAASSICTVDATTGVIALFGAGSCPIAMATAQTTNYIQHFETTTVTVALLSTSLVGIPTANLTSMGGTFFASPTLTQTISVTSGSNGASVTIPANALDSTTAISLHLLSDASSQLALISGASSSVLSVVVSWVAPDGSVPDTTPGNPISVTLTNPAIKAGAKVYSVLGNVSTLVGTATVDGSVTSEITSDPVLVVVNPAVAPPVSAPVIDNSAAIKAAKDLAEKKAAEEAALKAAQEKMEADAKALAEAKAIADAAALKAAQDAADASAKEAALLQAAKDAEIAAVKAADNIKPAVTLYSLSSKLKLNAYDTAYLTKYVKSLKIGASVTCIGYIYSKGTTVQKATTLAKSQASAVCAQMKKINKSLKTSIVTYPVVKAPKAAIGAKWVGVSYRIDGFKNP